MKILRKIALVLVLLVTCFTFSACSWWGGGNNSSSNNGGNNQSTNTPGESGNSQEGGDNDPFASITQTPSVNAIAGVYIPELDEISSENIAARNAIYTGVKNAAAETIQIPSVPDKSNEETSEQTATRIAAAKQRAVQLAKQEAIKVAVDAFTADTNLTLDKTKYGLFASEVDELITTLGVVAGTTQVTIDGTTTTESYTVSEVELGSIKTAIKNYLTNAKNIPGTAVEGETGEYASVLVAPIVEIQIFYVKSFKVEIEPGSSYLPDIPEGTPTMKQYRDVYYYDDENGYSTRFAEVDGDNNLIKYEEGKDANSERYILPVRKWITFYFEVAPSKVGGEFFFRSIEAVITFDKNAENAETTRDALLNYSGVVTAKSSQTNIDYSVGLQKYKYDFTKYHAKTVEEIEQEAKEQGLGDDYKVDDDTRKLIEEENIKNEELYSGYCQINCNLFRASESLGMRAPKFEQTSIDNVKVNNYYSKAIVFSKQQSGDINFYTIISKAENINGSIALNIATGGEIVSFGVENLKVGASEDDKTMSELMPNIPSSN